MRALRVYFTFLVAPRQPHSQWHFYFFKKKDEQILRLHLIMENNVGSSYVHRMCYEIAKILSANDYFFFFFFRKSTTCFSIDQVKFICWGQEIGRMSLKFLTFKQRCNNLTMFFRRFLLAAPIRNDSRQGTKE